TGPEQRGEHWWCVVYRFAAKEGREYAVHLHEHRLGKLPGKLFPHHYVCASARARDRYVGVGRFLVLRKCGNERSLAVSRVKHAPNARISAQVAHPFCRIVNQHAETKVLLGNPRGAAGAEAPLVIPESAHAALNE